jgi:AcrR family transcriptional regulator
MTTGKLNTAQPRERILATASDLFYKQGYRASGVNELIEKSGVAKATFYAHFPTKSDLCLAYLEQGKEIEFADILSFINNKKSPRTRFIAVIESLLPWATRTQFRGCAFLHMVAEVPDAKSALRRAGKSHYDEMRALVLCLADNLLESDPNKYGHLHAQELTTDYMLIFTGAIGLSEVYHDVQPILNGIEAVKRLIA